MEVLVVATQDAGLVDHLRAVVRGAIEASGMRVEITMALSDMPERHINDNQVLLWRDRRSSKQLATIVADPSIRSLQSSASVDTLANNATSENDTNATATLVKRIHKRDRKIKSLTATIEELKAHLADALARATFVEQEQEQFFEDVQHMKEAYDKLHTSHQKLLWEYLPSKDPDMNAIPKLSSQVDESESTIGPYALSDVLGYGQYATVFASHSPEQPHEPLAVKAIDKEKLIDLVTLHRVNSEIASLQDTSIHHSGILALRDVYHTRRHIYLVTERGGKDLFDFFGPREDGVPEEIIKKLMLGVALAVQTLHRNNYCHRDLKPENILYDPEQPSPAHSVKIVDFGLCTKATTPHDDMLHDFCGSPGFFAPELLLSDHYDGRRADMWSLGCILLELVMGNDCFAAMWMAMYELETLKDHVKFQSLMRKSLEAIRAFCHSDAWTYSVKLRSLMLCLLCENPQERPTVAQMLNHAWLHDTHRTATVSSRDVSQRPTSPGSPLGSPSRGTTSKPVLPSCVSFSEGCLPHPVDVANLAHSNRRPASAEQELDDHGSPHISVLLAAGSTHSLEPAVNSPPSKPAPPKLSLPSLSPEKPVGSRSPEKTFAKRAASTAMPPTGTPSGSLSSNSTSPTRSSSRYDDDDTHS